MALRDIVPPILRGDEAKDLGPASRARIESLAADAAAADEAAWLRDEAAARLRQGGATPAVEYLLALACRVHGEAERAHQTLLTLGEHLAESKQWEPLAAVAERALEIEQSQAAARLLVQAHEGLGRDPERIDALQRAFGIMPNDLELGLLLAVRLGESGQHEERRVLLAELLPRFAAEGRNAGLEEVALEFVEHDDVEGAVRMVRTLPAVQGEHAARETRQLLDIVFPVVAKAGRAGEGLDAIRAAVAKAAEQLGPTAAEGFRDAVVTSIRQGPAKALPDAEAVIAQAKLTDKTVPLLTALERFDAIAALPPGRAVFHTGFGAGRVLTDDGETVVLEFAQSRAHRMPYASARRTLSPVTEDDLRLLRATNPAALNQLLADEPAEVVVRALRAIGGAADAQKLKVFLIGSSIVPTTEWTAFWRRARAAAAKDRRIDSARAFEQHYQLAAVPVPGATAAEVNVPLPALEVRKPVKTNLATIRKFLSQHPTAERALSDRFARYVVRAMMDEEGEPADRARSGLYTMRWQPERAVEWIEVLRQLWESGLGITDLSGEDEQLALLEASHAAGVQSDAILSALDSRFSSVRARAQELQQELDARGREDLRGTLLQHAPRYPGAALRLIEEELGNAPGTPGERWRLFKSSLTLIEQSPKPSTAEKVLRWLEPAGAFDALLEGVPCPDDVRLQIRVVLRQWRSSDRFLFPAVEAADRLGLADEAETVRQARQKSSEKLFAQVGQQAEDTQLNVMTRATWERLKHELERLERELRTTIPQTIQKARELGDLKENAEYHSAKQKQANVSKLVRGLQLRLARARFVEDADARDGIVGLGSEVVLESDTQDVVRYWILGEEEHHHGEHVVSFQAPVGRALMGHAIGDEVELGEAGSRRAYRIVSIERKLPSVEDAPQS